jgi:hypothetical protein
MRTKPTMVPCQGPAGIRLLEQIEKVLDPVAVAYGGSPAVELRPIVERAWSEAFGVDLREPVFSRCAAAISSKRPWVLALWSNDWP